MQVGQNALFAATYIAWVIGFMAGIGAFVGPIRWALGRDLTHADAEYMAGKDLGKWRYWKYTTDHKVVGMQYLVMSLVLLGLGGFLAMLIRTELGATWTEVFDPNFYNSIIGTHGIVMIIAMIIVVAGPLGNFIVPIMIGARDMAFPRLNALSFWLLFAAVPPLVTNLLMGGMRDGWSVYQPLSAQAPVGMVGYQIRIITFAFSTGVASVNLITTVVTMRARGMTWNRVPVFAIGIIASSIMGLIWFPMFQYSQILALSDRMRRVRRSSTRPGRQRLAVREPLLAARPSRGLRGRRARHGGAHGARGRLHAQAAVLLQDRGRGLRRDRGDQLDRVGAPHVHDRMGARRRTTRSCCRRS